MTGEARSAGGTRVWQRAAPAGLAALSGAIAGVALPGGALPWLGPVAHLPLLVALHLRVQRGSRGPGTWLGLLGCGWLLGGVQAAIAGDWVAQALIRFGDVPPLPAWGLTVLGVGALLGGETLLFLAPPFLLGWRRPRWGFWLMLAWVAALQALLPRYLPWGFGIYLHWATWLVQPLDLIGPGGMAALVLAPQLVLYGWLCRHSVPGSEDLSRRVLPAATAGVFGVLVLAGAYGAWRTTAVATAERDGTAANVVAVQPNFSLAAPGEDPLSAAPERPRSLSALVRRSQRALAERPHPTDGPTVVLWPESAYPKPFFSLPRVAAVIGRWARREEVHLVLQSAGGTAHPGRIRTAESFHGLAVYVPPDGRPPAVYRKMALMPFGDAIPLAGAWPALERWMQRWWPRAGRYRAGDAFTVFDTGQGVQVAPMVCFDAVDGRIAAGMARNGANLGVVLANLRWFGTTRAAALMRNQVAFRAIETRMPVVLVALTGPSGAVDAAGRIRSPWLAQDREGVLAFTLRLPALYAFHARHRRAVALAYLVLFAGVAAWGGWCARGTGEARPPRT